MSRHKPPLERRLPDEAADQVSRSHGHAIKDLQRVPFAEALVHEDIELADGVVTPVSHELGRKPKFISVSPPRGASSTGRIEEVREAANNRAQVIVLKATGWGATITVDVAVC